DLQVSQVGLLETGAQDGDAVTVVWTETNQGAVAAPTGYQDRVTIRQRNADGSLGAVVLDTAVAFADSQPLAAGASRQRQFRFQLPTGSAGSGQFEIQVQADSNTQGAGSLFETNAVGDAETNNRASGNFSASLHVYPDLQVGELIVPASLRAGDSLTLRWRLDNIGQADALGDWVDRILLIPEDGQGGDLTLSTLRRQGPLAVGQGSDCEATVRIPPRLAGRWRIAVQTDVNRSLNEP
ncbi:hypothetical protein, partial [Parachitinimonas caeni]